MGITQGAGNVAKCSTPKKAPAKVGYRGVRVYLGRQCSEANNVCEHDCDVALALCDAVSLDGQRPTGAKYAAVRGLHKILISC